MGLSITVHPDRLEASAGPVAQKDRHKLEQEHGLIVAEIQASFPTLTVLASASPDLLTRGFEVGGLDQDTRMTLYAAAHAAHQRLAGSGLAWGGPG